MKNSPNPLLFKIVIIRIHKPLINVWSQQDYILVVHKQYEPIVHVSTISSSRISRSNIPTASNSNNKTNTSSSATTSNNNNTDHITESADGNINAFDRSSAVDNNLVQNAVDTANLDQCAVCFETYSSEKRRISKEDFPNCRCTRCCVCTVCFNDLKEGIKADCQYHCNSNYIRFECNNRHYPRCPHCREDINLSFM